MKSRELVEHQVFTLVAFMKRLEITKGGDTGALKTVQEFVSREMLESEYYEVIVQALGELDTAEAKRLNGIVNYCSTNFHSSKKILSAIAIPISILWKSQRDITYTLHAANQKHLDTLAIKVQRRINAQTVIFDNHLYTCSELILASPLNLQEKLKSIITGNQKYNDRPLPSTLISQIDCNWETRYFLGALVSHEDERLQLNDEDVQKTLYQWKHLGEWALLKKESSNITDTESRNVNCHGIFHLNNARIIGEKIIRKHKLGHLIETIATDVTQIEISFAINPLNQYIRILISNGWLTFKFKWTLFSDETEIEFYKDLNDVIKLSSSNIEEIVTSRLEEDEFEELLNSSTLAWMKNMT